MTYVIVTVQSQAPRASAAADERPRVCVDGAELGAGVYATVVIELPHSQSCDGGPLGRGYYAVFWPMDTEAPLYQERPKYFGPFAYRKMAEALIFEVSSGALEARANTAARSARRAYHGQLRLGVGPKVIAVGSDT